MERSARKRGGAAAIALTGVAPARDVEVGDASEGVAGAGVAPASAAGTVAGAAGVGTDRTNRDGTKTAETNVVGASAAGTNTAGANAAGMAEIDRRGRVITGAAWALVTGAGTGIGRCYALRLAALGYDLVIAGLTRAPLEAVREEILAAAGAKSASGRNSAGAHAAGTRRGDSARRPEVRIVEIDLARREASDELYAAVRGMGVEIDVLVNNAGIFSFRDILATPAERIERMILLHDMTLSKNCLAFGRDMAARGRGWILNMSSYSIWMPFPGMALYTATKAYVRSFSVAFAKEVRERGVGVTAVCPAGVATDLYGLSPYWQRIGLRIGVLISADSCARRGLRALWRGRRTIVPDWWNRAFIPLCKLVPMWMLRPLRRFTMKFQQ